MVPGYRLLHQNRGGYLGGRGNPHPEFDGALYVEERTIIADVALADAPTAATDGKCICNAWWQFESSDGPSASSPELTKGLWSAEQPGIHPRWILFRLIISQRYPFRISKNPRTYPRCNTVGRQMRKEATQSGRFPVGQIRMDFFWGPFALPRTLRIRVSWAAVRFQPMTVGFYGHRHSSA